MPKNPWIYKSRKRRRTRKDLPEQGEINSVLPTSSDIDKRMGTLSSEILSMHLNSMKKEVFYPDTRFQRSTTLFPAMLDDNSEIPSKILKRDPEDIQVDTGQESERFKHSPPDTSVEVMSEISLPSDNLQKHEDAIYSESKLQQSSTPFSAQGIENVVPPENNSDTTRRDPGDKESCPGQEIDLTEYYKMPDPLLAIEIMSELMPPNDNPMNYEDTSYPDTRFQRTTTSVFPAEEVEILPLETPSETLLVKEEFEIVPDNEQMEDSSSSNCCNAIEIDLTDSSQEVMSQPTTLDVESIPPEKSYKTLLVMDVFESSHEKLEMNHMSDSDYCVVIGNSNSPDEIDEIDLTGGSQRVLSRFITLD